LPWRNLNFTVPHGLIPSLLSRWSLTDMGKKTHNKEESQKGSKIPPKTLPNATKPNQNMKPTQVTLVSAEAKCTNSETTPQESQGIAQSANANFTIPKTPKVPNQTASSTTTSSGMSSQGERHRPVNTQAGDKRAREPSQNSKSSSSSIIPPPAKKLTYADAAKPDQKRTDGAPQELVWYANQLRIYKNTRYHAPISYPEFAAVRDKLFHYGMEFMRENPSQRHLPQATGNYYNKTLRCGVWVCKHEQAITWFKQAVMTVCRTAYKGWTNKDEQVTSFVKLFVPQGFENLTPDEYLEANRLVFETTSTSDIPWTFINEYVHHQKHTRIIVAQIPTETYELIQKSGKETSPGSNVWKAEGFMAPIKMTLATAGDMRPSKPQNPNQKPGGANSQGRDRGQVQPELQEQHEAVGSPTPDPPTSSSKTSTPVKNLKGSNPNSNKSSPIQASPVGSTPTREDGLNSNSNDPYLSNAQPAEVEMDNAETDGLDYAILNSTIPTDTDDMEDDGNNWA